MIMARNEPSKIGYLQCDLIFFAFKVTTKESEIWFCGPFVYKKYKYG